MRKIKLSSKAKTLEKLSKLIRYAKVLPLLRFSVSSYKKDKYKIINKIKEKFSGKVIIRSSSISEDSYEKSNAGKFVSVLDVNVNNHDDIKKSIEKVIKSFGKQNNNNDEFFVQTMLKDVNMSGVIFSCDIDTLSQYFIINYDQRI